MTLIPPSLADITGLVLADTPMPGKWSFYVDRTTNAYPRGPVHPTAFSCSWKLNDFGSASVTLPVDNIALEREEMMTPFIWRLWAFYDGQPVWGGMPTGITDDAGVTVSLTLQELPGYLTRRMYDVAGGHTYTNVEQTQIARDLAAPLADVLVSVVTEPGPGFLRTRAYEYLEGNSRGDLLTNLSGVLSGPEFRSEYAMHEMPGAHMEFRPECTLRIAYPRVGSTTSGLAIIVPSNALSYSGQWDGDQFRTRTFAVGDQANDTTGTGRPCVVVDRPQAGMPRIDKVDDWADVSLLSTLRERANTNATIYATPTFTVSASPFVSQPPLNSYAVGDDVIVNITDPLLPDGFVTLGRLTELSVEAGSGKTTWTVTESAPPARPRATLTTRLRRLDAFTQSLFRRNLTEIPY